MGLMSKLHIEMQQQMMHTIDRAQEGEIGILDALISLEVERKELEKSLAIVQNFKNEQLADIEVEAQNYKDGYKGFTIEVRSGGRIYKYDHINKWRAAQELKKEIESQAKQAFIAREKGILTATEDGEEIELPQVSYRKSSVIVREKEERNYK